jgi:Spy/CpxP family protein refolding chaperone
MIFQTNSAPQQHKSNLKLSLFSLCALLVLATTLRAQDPTPPPPSNAPAGQGPVAKSHEAREEQQTERLTKTLKLTPDQVTQLKAIQDATRQKLMALRDDSSSPRGHRREKMEAIQQDSRSQIRALLNDRQKARFDEMMQKQDERREHRPRNGGGSAPAPSPAPSNPPAGSSPSPAGPPTA